MPASESDKSSPDSAEHRAAEALSAFLDARSNDPEVTPDNYAPADPSAEEAFWNAVEGFGALCNSTDNETHTSPGTPPTKQPATPPSIPDYEPLHLIGKGGFGEVWLASEKLTGVYYAVKMIDKSEIGSIELDGVRAFKQRCAGQPHVVQLQHVGETPDCYYYVMELADDGRGSGVHAPEGYEAMTLREYLKRRGTLPIPSAVDITLQLLDGLGHLHEAGLLHRDVKPANVILCNGQWQLGDIGLVTAHDRTELRAGTPIYSPPESAGVVDRSGDLFSVGKVLTELLTGSPTDAGELAREAENLPPPGVLGVIEMACHASPADRYQSAVQMAEDLRRVVTKPERLRSSIAWLSVLAAVVVLAVGGWWLSRETGPAGPLPQGVSEVAEAAPLFEVHFKRSQEEIGYWTLEPRHVPLKVGNLIQIHAKLPDAAYPCVYFLAKGEQPFRLFPGEEGAQARVAELYCPPEAENPDEQKWLPLAPPTGTGVFLLLVADEPAKDLPALEAQLAQAAIPQLDRHALWLGDPRDPQLHFDSSRGLDPEPVTAPKGPLRLLDESWLSRYKHVKMIAFPFVEAEDD